VVGATIMGVMNNGMSILGIGIDNRLVPDAEGSHATCDDGAKRRGPDLGQGSAEPRSRETP
jgi:hypothetical protein